MERQMNSPMPGIIANRYRIERLLGLGGMAAVYRARDLLREKFGDPNPCVALKTLNDTFTQQPDANALLYSEYALTNQLHHAHIIRPGHFHIEQDTERAFLALELLDGPTLDQLIREQPRGLDWHALHSIALPLLSALAHVHEHGIVHGDIKPGNVILASNRLRLFDFGLARASAGALASLPRLNRQLTAWTPRYAAPELLEGEDPSIAGDIYAMACILYELASGHHPYSRLTALQAREMGQDKSLIRPARLPSRCWKVLRRSLAFEPEQRCRTAEQLLSAFRKPGNHLWRGWPRRPDRSPASPRTSE
jgi:serine/threonine-protein kinase Stk1